MRVNILLLCACCLSALAGAAQGVSNKGKEFWVSYGHHQFMEPAQNEAPPNSQNMVIYLSAEQPATVTVTIDSSGNSFSPVWQRTYVIPANTVISTETIPKAGVYDARLFTLPPSFGGTGAEGLYRKKGIHIVSDVPIVAYAHIYGSVNSGATMLLPTDTWGYSYTSMNSAQSTASYSYSWMYVVAKNDSTRIQITPSVPTRNGRPANVPFEVYLMKGQIYQVVGQGDDNTGNGQQLTGTTVKSLPNASGNCFPIGVFSGSSRTIGEPASCGSGGRDNDMQQAFPQHAWGKHYILAPTSYSGNPATYNTHVYKILVKDPATIVKRNGTVLSGLISNSYYRFQSNTPEYIEADKPVMVGQFMIGGSCINGGDGDPEMFFLSPLEQAIKKVGFYRNTVENINTNQVTLVIPTNGINSLTIDGVPFNSILPGVKFTQTILNGVYPGYSIVVKRWTASQAQCIIQSDSAFTGITWGGGGAESYGYNIGAYLKNLNSESDIHNVPDTTTGSSHTFNCQGTPVKLSMLIRYLPTKLVWGISTLGSKITPNLDVTINNPVFVDTPKINGIKYYKYTLPDEYVFSDTGTFDIPVDATSVAIDNCNNTERLYFTITVKPKPSAGFTFNYTGCIKDSLQFSGPSNSVVNNYTITRWKWNFGNGDTAIVRNPAYIYPATGTYNVKLNLITTDGCTSDSILPVTVNPVPSVALGITPSVICQGGSATFSDTSAFAGTTPIGHWFWDLANGPVRDITTNASQSATYATPGQYTIKHWVKVSDRCVSDTATKILTVNSKARVGTLTYPTSCLPPSGIANFTTGSTDAGGTTITNYNWNFGDPSSAGNNTSILQNPSHTYATPGNYTVTLTITTSTGCSGDTTFTVNANITPVLTYNNPAPVCAGTPVTVTVNGASTYTWSGPNLSSTTGATVIATPPTTTQYQVTGTSNGCSATANFVITINPVPAKPAVVRPVIYCQNATDTALVATGSAGNTLNWFNNPGLTGGSTTAPIPSTATAGAFTFYVNQSTQYCTGDTAAITVTITASIANNTIGTSQTICAGSPATSLDPSATIAGGTGTYTYQWQQSADGTNWTNIAGATSASYNPGAITTTTYYRRNVTSGLCGSTSNTVLVTVGPALSNYNINAVNPVCSGTAPALIDGQSPVGTGPFSYSWESSPDGTNWSPISGATGEDYQPGPLTANTYFRRKVVSGPCSAISNVIMVTVNPLPDGNITGPAAICQYDAASITFASSVGSAPFAISYTVTNPAGVSNTYTPSGLANNATIPVIPAGSAAGNYTIALNSITGSNSCIRNSGLGSITIAVTPTPVITIAPPAPICEGGTATLNASGASTYTWTASTGGNLNSTTGSSVTATPSGTGTFTYTATGTANGCTGSQSATVTVNPRPAKPSVISPVSYPQNGTASPLTATPLAGHTLTWYNNSSLTGGSTTAPTPSTATAGTFTFYVTQTSPAGCTSLAETITVLIEAGIAGNTIGKDTIICQGSAPNAVSPTGTLAGGSGTYTFQWQQSPNGSTWSDIPGATTATFSPGAITATTYYRRIVTSGLSVSTSNVITITVVPPITNYDISANHTICSGGTPNNILGQTPPGAGPFVYTWESSPDGTNWTTIAGATGVNYQPPALTATTHYRRKVAVGQCSATSNTVMVTVIPLANGSISGPAGICQYDAGVVTFTATAGTAPFTVSLTVTDPSGATSTITQQLNSGGTINVIPTNSPAGTYTIAFTSLTNSNTCVRSTGLNSITIVVTATPILTINPANTICQGSTATLTVSGASTYVWNGTGLSSTTGSTVTTTPSVPNSYNYTVTGTTNGCNATANTTVIVNPTPGKPTVTSPVSYCQGVGAAPLQATASGSNTLKWYTNPSLTGGVTTAPTPPTGTAGTTYYYVTQTNSFGCQGDSSTITVVVSPVITGNSITGGESLCQGGTPATLNNSGTVTGGNGTYAYQWQQSTNGGATWINIPGATGINYSPGPLNTTTEFRRMITSGLCTSISNSAIVNVFIGLANYDISASQTICEGTAPALLDGQTTTGTGPFTYTWQQSPDGTTWTDIASSNTEDYQPPVLTSTTFYRRRVTNGPCIGYSSAVQVSVNPLANGTLTAPAAICEYESADMTFTATAATAPFRIGYTVTYPSGTAYPHTVANLSSGAVLPLLPVGSAPGNYTVRLDSMRGSNGCLRLTGLGTITVAVNPTPVITVNPVTPVCENDSAVLSATGAATYTWAGPNLGATTGSTVKAAPPATSSYTVTGTSLGCSATKTVSATINPRPVVSISVVDNEICLDDSAKFSASATIASGTVQSYHWNFDNGYAPTVTNISPVIQSYTTHRTYVTTVYAVSDKGCSSATDTLDLIVDPLPVADFQVPAFVCLPNNTATFQNQSTIANGVPLSYTWNFGDIGSATNTSTAINGTHVYPDSAKYAVKLSVVSSQGCRGQVTKDFAAFFRKPVAKFAVTPDTLCQGIQNLFVDSSFAPGSKVEKRIWSFGDGNSLMDSVTASKIYTRPGNFRVALVVQNSQGCTSDTAYKNITVYLQPVIDAGPSFVVPAGTMITFNAAANSNSVRFAWSSSPGVTLSNPNVLKPQYLASQDAKFILTATGQGNCQATDSLTVKVLHQIGIPNAFSPNGDGVNDKWTIANLADYPNCVVEVFNRYGQQVFRSFGYTQPWDGTYKGQPLPVGTYYYIIEPKNGFPKMTGYVVIVK